MLVALVLLSAANAWAQPLTRVASGDVLAGEAISIAVDFEGDGATTALEVDLRWDTSRLTAESCNGQPPTGDAVNITCGFAGDRVRFVGFDPQLDPIENQPLGTIVFRLAADNPGPSTFLIEVNRERYFDRDSQEILPAGSQDGFVRAVDAGAPSAIDRFEDDGSPLTAKQTDSFQYRSDTHWFDSAVDEDWVAVRIARGTFVFDVCNGLCGDGGLITPNVQVYSAERLTNSAAAPIDEFNECEMAAPVQGTEVVGAEPAGLTRNQVYLLRIRDCYGLSGADHPYDLFLNLFTFDDLGARVIGNITDTLGTPVGAYVVVSSGQTTVSNPADGRYNTLVNSGNELQLTVLSPTNPQKTITVSPALMPSEARTVDIELKTIEIFIDSFE